MRRVYYGWYVVGMALIINAVLVGSTFASFGVFVIPVSSELMLSRASMNTALIFKNLGNAIFAPIVGRLLDRVSTRTVMVVCAIVFALSFITLGLSGSLWLSAFVMGVGIPIAYMGAGSLTNTLLIARWFKARRGRAMLLAGLGGSVGSLIGAPAAGLLVESYGWRIALIVMGVVIGALLMVLALIVRVRPGRDDVEVASGPSPPQTAASPAPADTAPMKISELLKSPHFWTMGLAVAIGLGPNQALIITFIPLGLEGGLSMLQATSLMSVLGFMAIVSALTASIFADRINRIVFLAGLFLLEAIVNAALLLDTGYYTLLASAAVVGIVGGTLVHTFYALLADRFGTASFGTVRGVTFTLVGVSGMIAVRYGGEVYDRTGDYDFMFATFVVTHIAAALLMLSTLLLSRRAPAVEPRLSTP